MQANLPGGNGHLKANLKLEQIVYLGAHNSLMAKCYGWAYTQQNVTITEQFETYGARHFKIPLNWHLEKDVPEIVIAHEEHGENNCNLSVVQRVFKSPEKAKDRLKEQFDLTFKANCQSTLKKMGPQGGMKTKLLKNCIKIAQKLHNLFLELRADQRALAFQENNPPTLGWCRENQMNVMITIEPKKEVVDNLIHYTHQSYYVSAQVDWRTDPLEDVESGEVERGYTNKSNGMILSPFLEIHLNPENSLKIDYQYRHKYNHYHHVKKRFLQYYKHCNKMPNFIVAYFIDQGNPSQVVDEINYIINQNNCFRLELL